VASTRTLDDLIMRYVGERIRRGEIQGTTARNVRNHLVMFSASFAARPLDQLGPRSLERWVEEMTKADLAKSTQALRISSVRGFAKWCVRNGHVVKDWTMDSPVIRRPRRMPRDMTNDHVRAALKQARDERERLLVLLTWGCGLRCVEVSRLNVDDYERATSRLFVVGKAMHERWVSVPPAVRAAIDAYLATETHMSGPLIRTHTCDKRRLGPERISGILGRLCRDAGFKVRNYDGRSAHGFRAAGASDLLEAADGDLLVVQEFLGHANPATTGLYLRQAGMARQAAAQNRRELGAEGPDPGELKEAA
jgi:site-specific recombinase XerD